MSGTVNTKPHGIDEHQWVQLLAAGWGGAVADRTSTVSTYAGDALDKFLKDYEFTTVFDLGCGSGTHARHMRKHGKTVTAMDIRPHPMGFVPEIIGDFMKMEIPQQFDALWCSHVLEHMPDPHAFLKKALTNLKPGGVLAITVPPLKHAIVDGHINLFNTGTLLYRLVIAGLDCSSAAVKSYGYNLSVIVRKVGHGKSEWTGLPELAEYFPLPARKGFDGRIKSLNW